MVGGGGGGEGGGGRGWSVWLGVLRGAARVAAGGARGGSSGGDKGAAVAVKGAGAGVTGHARTRGWCGGGAPAAERAEAASRGTRVCRGRRSGRGGRAVSARVRATHRAREAYRAQGGKRGDVRARALRARTGGCGGLGASRLAEGAEMRLGWKLRGDGEAGWKSECMQILHLVPGARPPVPVKHRACCRCSSRGGARARQCGSQTPPGRALRAESGSGLTALRVANSQRFCTADSFPAPARRRV